LFYSILFLEVFMKGSGWRHVALWVPLLVVISQGALFAQQAAELVGSVRDPSGAVVPNAMVKATNEATGVSRSMPTNSAGDYDLTPLIPGSYTLEVSFKGFRTMRETGLILRVNQVAREDVKLEVGAVAEQISVQAAAPVLASENATTGEVVENTRIIEMPLDGRNYLDLARLTPGVGFDTGPANGIYINGGASQDANLFLIDGADNFESGFGRPTMPLSIDAIQEFKIQTSDYSAEMGRAPMGQVNVITKSGSNSFHGAAYEFNRVASLAAIPMFTQSAASREAEGLSAEPPYIRNQYGGSIGGPIKKDKTFFFFNYEGLKVRESTAGVLTVPTAAERQGDFSATGVTIYDPLTLNSATNARQPFSGDAIPTGRLDPVFLAYMKYEPLPTAPGLVNNYTASLPTNTDLWQMTGRIDQNFSEHDMLSARYTYKHETDLVPGEIGNSLFPGFGAIQRWPIHNGSLNWVHTFNPRTLSELLIGFNRYTQWDVTQNFGVNESAAVGLPTSVTGIPVAQLESGWPNLSVSGYSVPYQNPYRPVTSTDTGYQVGEKITREFSRHTLKLGGEYVYIRMPQTQYVNATGAYSFGATYTTPVALGPGTIENALGDFELGDLVSSSRVFGYPTYTADHNWESFYAQDDFRPTPNLTINLGLRWELYSGTYERFDRFNTFCPALVEFCQVGENNDIPRAGYPKPWRDFMPRVGFAWRPLGNSKTVLRGGYGHFYNYPVPNNFYNMAQSPPRYFQQPFQANLITPNLTMEDPFPGPLPTIPGPSGELTGFGANPHFKYGYVEQFNLGVQREVARDTLLEVSYVGNHGVSLSNPGWNINTPVPGLDPNIQDRRPWPQLYGVTYGDSNGMEWYDSLQARFERRFRKGYSYAVAYTYAKSLAFGCAAGGQNDCEGVRNPVNFAVDKGPGPEDIRHRLVFSFVADLPFGRGKALLGSASHGLDTIVGGWEFTGLATLQSGLPITPYLDYDNTNGTGGSEPDMISNPAQGAPHTINEWYNINAFQPPPSLASIIAAGGDPWRSQGNAANGCIFGPGLKTANLGLFKRFTLPWREQTLVLRLEAFSAFNHPILGEPSAGYPIVPGSTGVITSASGSRTVQIGLRYEF
jgi:hypothetical protein